MRNTIADPGLLMLIKIQLRHAKFVYLDDPIPCIDYNVQGVNLAIYTAFLSTESTGGVFDAWLVTGGDITGFYNRECFTTIKDAAIQHVGRLVLDGNFKFVDPSNARKRSRSKRT